MLNYMKSEWFRIFRGEKLLLSALAIAAFPVIMNITLYISSQNIEDFRYATVPFSLSSLIQGLTSLFMAAAVVAVVLYGDERKNGIQKNAIAYGISRESIFIGKCITGIASATIIAIVVLVFYIGSAYLLLDTAGADEAVWTLITGMAAAFPAILSSIILAAVLINLFNSTVAVVFGWIGIVYVLPQLLRLLGRLSDIFTDIAGWIPYDVIAYAVDYTENGVTFLWHTPEGVAKCLITGFGFCVIFTAAGLLGFRKKEV